VRPQLCAPTGSCARVRVVIDEVCFAMRVLTLSLAVLIISSCASNAPVPTAVPMKSTNVTISARELGQTLQLPGVLHQPLGDGPFPAIVMLSGYGGWAGGGANADHQAFWARKLVQWGYVALQVDSFLPRGPRARDMGEVSSQMTACDAYAAKAWLSTLDFVNPDAIGVIGWSHGGIAVLDIIDSARALQREVAGNGLGAPVRKMDPFKVAVAFYPYAHPLSAPDTPLLVLIGARDDICPARFAPTIAPGYTGTGLEMSLTIYPNAYHAFDVEAVGERGLNIDSHHLQYDPQATADALQRTRDFLHRHIVKE
jgi:dienelactone hydrolase